MDTVGVELEYADIRPVFTAPHLPLGWVTHGDASIRNTDGSWSLFGAMNVLGAEVRTTGGLTLEQLEADLGRILPKLRELGAEVNNYCGLHIHVGTPYTGKDQLVQLATYFRDHPTHRVCRVTPRRRKMACNPITDDLIADLQQKDEDVLRSLSHARQSGRHNPHRERDVNVLSIVKHGTLEFRGFPSSLDLRSILNAAHWSLQAKQAALEGSPLPPPLHPFPARVD